MRPAMRGALNVSSTSRSRDASISFPGVPLDRAAPVAGRSAKERRLPRSACGHPRGLRRPGSAPNIFVRPRRGRQQRRILNGLSGRFKDPEPPSSGHGIGSTTTSRPIPPSSSSAICFGFGRRRFLPVMPSGYGQALPRTIPPQVHQVNSWRKRGSSGSCDAPGRSTGITGSFRRTNWESAARISGISQGPRPSFPTRTATHGRSG